jgi:hypothetical protein
MNDMIEGYSDTRDRKYPTYLPGDTRIEGFCTLNELKKRIEQLEEKLEQVCQLLNAGK